MSRHSTQDEVPAVTPYDRKKICTLCNVEVRSAALCIRLSGFVGVDPSFTDLKAFDGHIFRFSSVVSLLLNFTSFISYRHLFVQFVTLTLSLPDCLMEFCKVALTFESLDEILWCDHLNESSLAVLSHGCCFSKFYKMKFGNLVEICLWLRLAVKGLIQYERL